MEGGIRYAVFIVLATALIALVFASPFAAAIRDCGPDYNYGANDNYKVMDLTDDLYCPYDFFPAAIWIDRADGMVLNCHGRSISGNNIPALRIERSDNVTLINCNLSASAGKEPILYVNATEALIINDPNADAKSYLRPPPAAPAPTPAPAAKTGSTPTSPVPDGTSDLGAKQAANLSNVPPRSAASAAMPWAILLVLAVVAIALLAGRRKRAARRGALLLLFALTLALHAHLSEAACATMMTGNVCDFFSSNCGTDVPGCVNQCSGNVTCSSVTAGQTICGDMGCTWGGQYGTCTGGITGCSGRSQSNCNPVTGDGCSWQASSCTGSPTYDCTIWDGDRTDCTADPLCYCLGGVSCPNCRNQGCGNFSSQQTNCTNAGCTWNAAVCAGASAVACGSYPVTQQTNCTAEVPNGCSWSSSCGGTGSTPCSNYWWDDDAACTTCTARGCSYSTQCGDHAVHPTCYAAPTACSARLCSSYNPPSTGGCEKSNGCTCTIHTQCANDECSYDTTGGLKCTDGTFCYDTSCNVYADGSYYAVCASAGGSGTNGARNYCSTLILGYDNFGPKYCGYQANRCDTANCRVVMEANACSGGTCQTGGAGDNVTSNCGTTQACSGATCNTVTNAATSCDGDTNYYASLGACTYNIRYSACTNPTTCDTTAAINYASGGTGNVVADKVANTMSGSTSPSVIDASSAANACDYTQHYQDCPNGLCSGNLRYAECTGGGACDNTATTHYQAGSTLYAADAKVLDTSCASQTPTAVLQCASTVNTCGVNTCTGTSQYTGCNGATHVCDSTCAGGKCTSGPGLTANAGNVYTTAACAQAAPSSSHYCDNPSICTVNTCMGANYYAGCNVGGSCSSCPGNCTMNSSINPAGGNVYSTAACAQVVASSTNKCGTPTICTVGGCTGASYYAGCSAGSCSSCPGNCTVNSTLYNATAGTVYNSTACTPTAPNVTYNCNTSTSCADGNCTGTTYYWACNGLGTCLGSYNSSANNIFASVGSTLNSTCGNGNTPCNYTAYNACTGNGTPFTCTQRRDAEACDSGHLCTAWLAYDYASVPAGSVCNGTGSNVTANLSLYSYANYTSCGGNGSPYSCQNNQTRYGCAAAGNPNGSSVGQVTMNIPLNYVCNNTAPAYNGTPASAVYYAFNASNLTCNQSNSPASGFGGRLFNVYGCNGTNGQSATIAGYYNLTCGTGCCYANATDSYCIASGNESYNFWNFGLYDSTAPDYCFNSVVTDCNTNNGCLVSGKCKTGSCTAINKLVIQNSAGNNITVFAETGNILLKGKYYTYNTTTPTAGSFRLTNATGVVAWVSQGGDLAVAGNISQNQGSVTPSGNNDLIIQNAAGTNVTYIDGATGNLYTLGTVTNNSLP